MIFKYHHYLYISVIMFMLLGCKKESLPHLEINSDKMTLKYGETYQFNIKQGDQPIPSGSVQWSSSDEMTGTIGPSGQFKAGIIGSTVVTGTLGEQIVTCEVTVVPLHELFHEPLTRMGSSMQEVKDYEERQLVDYASNKDRLEYIEELEHVHDIIYHFTENKLGSVAITFIRFPDINERIVSFYRERYNYEGTLNEGAFNKKIIFADRDKTFRIYVDANPSPSSWYIGVVYLPYSPRY